jgi:hypothetical protein
MITEELIYPALAFSCALADRDIDIKDPAENGSAPGFTAAERGSFGGFLADWSVDVFREQHPEGPEWPRGAGAGAPSSSRAPTSAASRTRQSIAARVQRTRPYPYRSRLLRSAILTGDDRPIEASAPGQGESDDEEHGNPRGRTTGVMINKRNLWWLYGRW